MVRKNETISISGCEVGVFNAADASNLNLVFFRRAPNANEQVLSESDKRVRYTLGGGT